MKVSYLRTTCFDQWQVNFSVIEQIGSVFYKFSITDEKTGSQYHHSGIYSTETKAYLSAYFLCLRASLDKEQQPALLIDLETGHILSSNLPAFELLAINATGASVLDFMIELKDYRQLEQRLWQTGNLHQSILLCDADRFLRKCEIEAQVAPYYSKWAIFYFQSNQSQPCFLQLSH